LRRKAKRHVGRNGQKEWRASSIYKYIYDAEVAKKKHIINSQNIVAEMCSVEDIYAYEQNRFRILHSCISELYLISIVGRE